MSTLRLHLFDRGGYWRIPRDEFDAAQRDLPWLTFNLISDDEVDLFEVWAEGRPNVVWVDDNTAKKAQTMREMLRDVYVEAANSCKFVGSNPFEGTFSRPAFDRLIDAISHSDAIFYLDARDTPVSF